MSSSNNEDDSPIVAGTVPEFLYQLMKMLTDNNREIIEWNGTVGSFGRHGGDSGYVACDVFAVFCAFDVYCRPMYIINHHRFDCRVAVSGSICVRWIGAIVSLILSYPIQRHSYRQYNMLCFLSPTVCSRSYRRIEVHNPHRMEEEVLSRYFRHSKYSSFQRVSLSSCAL